MFYMLDLNLEPHQVSTLHMLLLVEVEVVVSENYIPNVYNFLIFSLELFEMKNDIKICFCFIAGHFLAIYVKF